VPNASLASSYLLNQQPVTRNGGFIGGGGGGAAPPPPIASSLPPRQLPGFETYQNLIQNIKKVNISKFDKNFGRPRTLLDVGKVGGRRGGRDDGRPTEGRRRGRKEVWSRKEVFNELDKEIEGRNLSSAPGGGHPVASSQKGTDLPPGGTPQAEVLTTTSTLAERIISRMKEGGGGGEFSSVYREERAAM